MPRNRFLLDTNAAIDLLNRSPSIAALLAEAGNPAIPLIVRGELEFGARNSPNAERNLDSLEGLLRETDLILPDRATAAVYGEIQSALRRKGRPIPINDIWIAAMAIQYDMILVTHDSHFFEIDGLKVGSW